MPGATEKFKEVQTAYDVLSDAAKRQNYDQFGQAGVDIGSKPGGGGDPFDAYRRSAGGSPWWYPGVARRTQMPALKVFDVGGRRGQFF